MPINQFDGCCTHGALLTDFCQECEDEDRDRETSERRIEDLKYLLEVVYNEFEDLQKQYDKLTGRRWVPPAPISTNPMELSSPVR